MGSRFLASAGGRFAHLAVSIALAVAAYTSFCDSKIAATRAMAAGMVSIIVSLIVAVILSTRDFRGHAIAITLGGPLVGFYYVYLLQLTVAAGSGVGSILGTVAAFVFLAGIVLGLRTSPVTAKADAKLAGSREVISHA
jgi:hypothetical protein